MVKWSCNAGYLYADGVNPDVYVIGGGVRLCVYRCEIMGMCDCVYRCFPSASV